MITMLTCIVHIGIGECKNPFKFLENNPSHPGLALLLWDPPKIAWWSKKRCMTITKKVPNDPKKRGLTIVQLICTLLYSYASGMFFCDLKAIPKNMPGDCQARDSKVSFSALAGIFWDLALIKCYTLSRIL